MEEFVTELVTPLAVDSLNGGKEDIAWVLATPVEVGGLDNDAGEFETPVDVGGLENKAA